MTAKSRPTEDEWMSHPETGLTRPLPATLTASEAQGEGSDEREAREVRWGVSDTFIRPCLWCGKTVHVQDSVEQPHEHHELDKHATRAAYAWWQGYDAATRAALAAEPNPPAAPHAEDGAALIATERRRQIAQEGYTSKHDAEHGPEVLAKAASVYAQKAAQSDEWVSNPYPRLDFWPWPNEDFKPRDRRTALVKAGALIAAALDAIPAPVADPSAHHTHEGRSRECPTCAPYLNPTNPEDQP